MKKLLILITASALAGCTFFAPVVHNVRYYDLGTTAPVLRENFQVNVEGQFGTQMMIRTAQNEIAYDAANVWMATPATLLRNHILAAMTRAEGGSEGEAKRLKVSIFRFEYDLENRCGYLGVEWEVSTTEGPAKTLGKGRRLFVSPPQPADQCEPASALANCAGQFILILDKRYQ